MTAGQKIGSYTLVEKLGAGGLGEVWKARDRRLNRIVALKFVSAGAQRSSPLRDLLREARAASALNHPNIITIFEVSEEESGFLAMEFVEGETLRARLKRSPVPLEETLDIAGQALNGLAAAHRQGIVHRDLKPENIMLRADGYVKLLDFGLAKVLPWHPSAAGESTAHSAPSESGALVGTYTYMSPEQARGQAASPSSDVFSFGIILYELLAGTHPFRAETVLDTLTAIVGKEPPPASAVAPAVPGSVSDVTGRALQKAAGARFPSAAEFAAALKQAREAQPLTGSAGAVSTVHHKPRWLQAIGALLIALVLLAVGWALRPLSGDGSRGPAVESVAVMSFRTDSEDARASPLARSLPEDLGSALSRAGLRVASHSAVLGLAGASDPRTVGAQLGVDAVVEGSVRSSGNRFKLHIELVSTHNGFQLWSDTVTVEIEDPLGGEKKALEDVALRLRDAAAGRR